MRLLNELPRDTLPYPCALTIGTFDGVHRGHAFLVETLKREAASRELVSTVLTFEDMPYRYFNPAACARLLTLPDEKRDAFAALKIDQLLLVPFDETVANQSADDFVRHVLVGQLNMKLLVVGPDFALGKGRAGDINALRALGDHCNFEVLTLREKLDDEGPISSTRIRECIEDGHMRTAARLLGRAFEMQGQVVSGRQLGRTIGVPTINLQIHPRKVSPCNGVYAAHAFLDFANSDSSTRIADARHRAALNIGTRPTVGGQNLSIEFHVIGEEIPVAPLGARLQIIERLRDEKKFDGVSELVEQMQRDIARAAAILSG